VRSRAYSLILLSMLASALLGAQPEAAPETEESRVQKVFRDYKQALMTGDGDAAAALVDEGTLDYFQGVQRLALSGSREEVSARSFIDRLLVVTMRNELEREVLESLELDDLLHHAIEAGWIGKASISRLDIGEVSIDGDEASGVALTGGQVPSPEDGDPLRYSFVREDGEWKFRFSSLVESLNHLITQFTAQLGTNEDDLIFTLVQAISGKQVLPEIWDVDSDPPSPEDP